MQSDRQPLLLAWPSARQMDDRLPDELPPLPQPAGRGRAVRTRRIGLADRQERPGDSWTTPPAAPWVFDRCPIDTPDEHGDYGCAGCPSYGMDCASVWAQRRQPAATHEEARAIRARMEREGSPTNADVLRACRWPTNRVGELIGLARGM